MDNPYSSYSDIFFEPKNTIPDILSMLDVFVDDFYLIIFTSASCPLCEKQTHAINQLRRVFMNRLHLYHATMTHEPSKQFAKSVLQLKVVPSMILIKDNEPVLWQGIQSFHKLYKHFRTRTKRCGNCKNRAPHRRRTDYVFCQRFRVRMSRMDSGDGCFK